MNIGESIIQGMKEALESAKNMAKCEGCARRRKKIKQLQEEAWTRMTNRAQDDK